MSKKDRFELNELQIVRNQILQYPREGGARGGALGGGHGPHSDLSEEYISSDSGTLSGRVLVN